MNLSTGTSFSTICVCTGICMGIGWRCTCSTNCVPTRLSTVPSCRHARAKNAHHTLSPCTRIKNLLPHRHDRLIAGWRGKLGSVAKSVVRPRAREHVLRARVEALRRQQRARPGRAAHLVSSARARGTRRGRAHACKLTRCSATSRSGPVLSGDMGRDERSGDPVPFMAMTCFDD